MKRKRTIANLLQESNEPVTPAANLISTLIQSKKLDEKKTFVKEYFDKDMTQDDTTTTNNNIITETNTNTIMDSIVQNESSNTTISTLINQKSQKKSKIKDYVFDNSNNNNNTSTCTDSSPCSISSVSSLLEVNLGDVKTSTKTIGSLINNNNNNCKEKVKLLCKNECIEKKSKIKDYITNTPSSPSPPPPPSAQTLSITNHQPIIKNTIYNKLNESKLKFNAFNQRMISNNKTKKRNKIKDYIVSQRINDLIGLNSTKKISNCKKGFSKNNFTLKKMNVKNHLQQNLKQTDTIIENPKIISTNNKSTIKEYLQNKSQRSKMINNKENLMTKKIYFKNGL
jgi:hypothetical protein